MTMKPQWEFYRDGAYHDLQISKWGKLVVAETGSINGGTHVDPNYNVYYPYARCHISTAVPVRSDVNFNSGTHFNDQRLSLNTGAEFCSRADFQDGAAFGESFNSGIRFDGQMRISTTVSASIQISTPTRAYISMASFTFQSIQKSAPTRFNSGANSTQT
eukprot:gnl/TRDRNA2_/TRDRNA2_185757_c0_seq1.p1 gnl/TRDRNA2_/TRDRNA2_185757_c0~~gnl/TRDRNA2_/TRDRNA2_185757_c0_seq1.p1  ORF type:complete len:160 (-),score=12.34 gnl/TRDRNA2_/TRDRNA2_185757_c0_seq1:622-1101(-)